jgi:hypothetical protein
MGMVIDAFIVCYEDLLAFFGEGVPVGPVLVVVPAGVLSFEEY